MRWGIGLLAAAVLLGGSLLVGGYLRMSGIPDRIGGYPSVAAGQSELVTFDSAGGRTAYYEATCFDCDGRSGRDIPDLTITSEDGEALEIGGYATDGAASPEHTGGYLSYSRGRFTGEPEYTFTIPEPGTYRVEVGEGAARDGQMRLGLSVAPVWISGLAMIVVGVLAGGALLVAGGIVVAVAAWRRRHLRRARPGVLPGPPPGPRP